MDNKIRILVADDHPVVRDGLVALLTTQPDFSVIGQASTGREVISKVPSFQPDILLLDLEMPEMDGVAVLWQLSSTHPELKTIVFTAFDTDERILEAIQAGAKGYLLKDAPRADLFRAIREVYGGGSLLQPIVASKLLRHMRADSKSDTPPPADLTDREQDVLLLLAHGKTNRQIAEALFITERTVKYHVSSILGKLGAGNRTEAVSIAAQRGIIDL